ncbi:MAG: prepilin-type N-terminal cleavage/methylation domain-containing protein [Patescibacteria group bacterium]|jgi:hypothetical protein
MKIFQINKKGFTLVETIIYLLIATLLMIIISSLVLSVFKARRHFIAINDVNHNARFIVHYLTNRLHNTNTIVDVSPAPEQFHFYQLPDMRFSIEVLGDDMVYREGQDIGSGFPDQSTLSPIILNNSNVSVSNLSLIAVDDYRGISNQGIQISFRLTSGTVEKDYSYYQRDFSTFLSIR